MPPTLPAILAPYVNARLSHERDADGYVIERTSFVDIDYKGATRIDADIRCVDQDGIRAFFYCGSELIPWGDIRSITVRDESGERVVYRNSAQSRKAA